MFTGIVEKLATLTRFERGTLQAAPGAMLTIQTGYSDLVQGESVAVDGACLTVLDTSPEETVFFVSEETLARTRLGPLLARPVTERGKVNLERALQLGARLSGHIVQGHIDGLARLKSLVPQGDAYLLEVALPARLARYCVEKGSITLNGVSLTVNRIVPAPPGGHESGSAIAAITLIPHTWSHTNLGALHPGDLLNVEVDVLAKYVESLFPGVPRP